MEVGESVSCMEINMGIIKNGVHVGYDAKNKKDTCSNGWLEAFIQSTGYGNHAGKTVWFLDSWSLLRSTRATNIHAWNGQSFQRKNHRRSKKISGGSQEDLRAESGGIQV